MLRSGGKGLRLSCARKLGVPLESDRYAGEIFGLHQGCQVPFRISRGNVGFLLRRCRGKGLHLAMTGKPRGFSPYLAGFSSNDGELRMPLDLAQRSPISIRVTSGSQGYLPSHCRANRPHLGMCPQIPCSFPVATGISGLHSNFTQGVRPRSSGSKELRSPRELRRVSLAAN